MARFRVLATAILIVAGCARGHLPFEQPEGGSGGQGGADASGGATGDGSGDQPALVDTPPDGSGTACTFAASCPTGESCEYPAGTVCSSASAMGTCTAIPSSCDMTDAPVCGCDGTTYMNDCLRRMAGARLEKTGACLADGGANADGSTSCGMCAIPGWPCCEATKQCYPPGCSACCM